MENLPSAIFLVIVSFFVLALLVNEFQILLRARRQIQQLVTSERDKRDRRIADQHSRLRDRTPSPMVRRPV